MMTLWHWLIGDFRNNTVLSMAFAINLLISSIPGVGCYLRGCIVTQIKKMFKGYQSDKWDEKISKCPCTSPGKKFIRQAQKFIKILEKCSDKDGTLFVKFSHVIRISMFTFAFLCLLTAILELEMRIIAVILILPFPIFLLSCLVWIIFSYIKILYLHNRLVKKWKDFDAIDQDDEFEKNKTDALENYRKLLNSKEK